MALFSKQWASELEDGPARDELLADASRLESDAEDILELMERYLWDDANAVYRAYNTSSKSHIDARTWVMTLPLWGHLVSEARWAK